MRPTGTRPPDHRRFTSHLLTSLATAMGGRDCRVCNQPIRPGDIARSRAWHLEQAHEACGWFRADEGEPVTRRKPGGYVDYWEWRCPECNLDACGDRAPEDNERRCGRCKRPRVGERAHFVQIVTIRGVRIPIGVTCTVREELPDGWGVSFAAATEVRRVPFGAIVRIQKGPRATEDPR